MKFQEILSNIVVKRILQILNVLKFIIQRLS